MRTYYYAFDTQEDYIFDNFPDEVKHLVKFHTGSDKPFEVTIDGQKKQARMACKKSDFGSIYVLTTEKKFINRKKYFRELVELSTIGIKPLVNFQNDLIEGHSEEREEFIHNVVSLNTYAIQDLFALIPQKVLTENITKQSNIVRDIIKEQPNVTVATLLNLIKYNLATKVEFSVFERTLKPSAYVDKSDHSVRSIILSILQIFIDDFEKKKIDVTLDACEKILNIDYDSLFVSLYYLLDNSVKYCCPRTTFKIIFKQEGNDFSILFIMISLKIDQEELPNLLTRGYRSDSAKKLNVDGSGIGMYRITKTLKLNNASLTITPRVNAYAKQVKDFMYEGNEFKITFKNQRDWF